MKLLWSELLAAWHNTFKVLCVVAYAAVFAAAYFSPFVAVAILIKWMLN